MRSDLGKATGVEPVYGVVGRVTLKWRDPKPFVKA
jgi:hypothetical protein